MVAESKAISVPAKVTERRFIRAPFGFFGFLILFGACQQIDKKVGEQDHILKDLTTIPLPSITFLDSLTDSLQPQKIWLKDHSLPVPIYVPMNTIEVYNNKDNAKQSQFISPPQIIQRPYLKNDKGEAIFDAKGNHYYLGDGGISHFTTFTTDEGLGLDNITSSL
nr:hypothetical protein [Cytophagales bacterium]